MQMMNSETLNDKQMNALQTQSYNESSLINILLCVYFILSIFEAYLNNLIGSVTKYFIIIICLCIFVKNNGKIKIRYEHLGILLWLVYKFCSLLWSQNYATPRIHWISQISFVLFLMFIISYNCSNKTIRSFLFVYHFSSFVMGIISLLFGAAYHGNIATRQVAVILGQEIDPNNLAALLLIGISFSLYNLLMTDSSRKSKMFSILILIVNGAACLLTGSRTGLATMAVIFIFAFLFDGKKKGIGTIIQKLLLMLVILMVGYFLISNYLPATIKDRLFAIDEYGDGSGRLEMWGNVWNAYISSPISVLFGIGWGSATFLTQYTAGVHNTLLSMLCDVGLIGTLMFMIPILRASFSLIQKKKFLPIILLIAQLIPSFFFDAINKRFLWNAIFILFIFYINPNIYDNDSIQQKSEYRSRIA